MELAKISDVIDVFNPFPQIQKKKNLLIKKHHEGIIVYIILNRMFRNVKLISINTRKIKSN